MPAAAGFVWEGRDWTRMNLDENPLFTRPPVVRPLPDARINRSWWRLIS